MPATANHGSPRNQENPEKHGIDEVCPTVSTLKTDGEGFEPTVQLPAQQFSRLPP
jgi:hypothetical protein